MVAAAANVEDGQQQATYNRLDAARGYFRQRIGRLGMLEKDALPDMFSSAVLLNYGYGSHGRHGPSSSIRFHLFRMVMFTIAVMFQFATGTNQCHHLWVQFGDPWFIMAHDVWMHRCTLVQQSAFGAPGTP